jgi:hypothetical protein
VIYFTLRTIIILMETIRSLYKRSLGHASKLSLMRPRDCLRPCVIGRIVGDLKGRGVTWCDSPPGCPATG